MVPESPTATNRPPPVQVTAFSRAVVPELCGVQVTPSGDVSTPLVLNTAKGETPSDVVHGKTVHARVVLNRPGEPGDFDPTALARPSRNHTRSKPPKGLAAEEMPRT